MKCPECGGELDCFDIGCYRKLVNRGATEFLCRNCLAPQISMTRDEIDRLSLSFQRQGCLLFPPIDFDEQERLP